MSLRKKTLIIVGLTIVGLIVILYVVTQHILLYSFATLEEQYTPKKCETGSSLNKEVG
jgi:sensor domain CHASE-containing protein